MYDTINKAGNYTAKVRMLGQFHRQLGASKEPDGMDINDPLYGNVGGADEQVLATQQSAVRSRAGAGFLPQTSTHLLTCLLHDKPHASMEHALWLITVADQRSVPHGR